MLSSPVPTTPEPYYGTPSSQSGRNPDVESSVEHFLGPWLLALDVSSRGQWWRRRRVVRHCIRESTSRNSRLLSSFDKVYKTVEDPFLNAWLSMTSLVSVTLRLRIVVRASCTFTHLTYRIVCFRNACSLEPTPLTIFVSDATPLEQHLCVVTAMAPITYPSRRDDGRRKLTLLSVLLTRLTKRDNRRRHLRLP